MEKDGVGEEPEEDRATQPGALHGQTFLQSGHEPLWRHGKLNGPYWGGVVCLSVCPGKLVKTINIDLSSHRLMRSSGRS